MTRPSRPRPRAVLPPIGRNGLVAVFAAALLTAIALVLVDSDEKSRSRPLSASGGGPPVLGIADQSAGSLSEPLFKQLGVRHTRYITPWNAALENSGRLDQWMHAARSAGLEPLVAFNHSSGDRCPARPCRAPTIGQYRKAVSVFRRKYPWVRQFQPWNEANHQSQPTAKRPKLAAQYYNALRQMCRSCTIVAADVLDSNNMERWLRVFKRYARGKPTLWGLHNYSDVNRFRRKGYTQRMLRAVRGKIWLTETGGVVKFETTSGRVALRHDERRAAKAYRFLFTLTRKHRGRIRRVYLYQWRKTSAWDRFDAGIVRPDGQPRPSFYVVKSVLASARAARRG